MATSKSCLLLCVLSFVLLVPPLEALPATQNLLHRLQRRSGIRLCGRMLVDTLASICQKGGNSWDSSNYEELPESRDGLDFFRKKNPVFRRGVADECCVRSCNIAQLFSYCGRNPGKYA